VTRLGAITHDPAPPRTNNGLWAPRVALPDVRRILAPPGQDDRTVHVHDGSASWATPTTAR